MAFIFTMEGIKDLKIVRYWLHLR